MVIFGSACLFFEIVTYFNNELWKVPEALRNTFVKSPQTVRKSRDGRLSRALVVRRYS